MHMKSITHKHFQKNVRSVRKIRANNYIDEELKSQSQSDSDNEIDIEE